MCCVVYRCSAMHAGPLFGGIQHAQTLKIKVVGGSFSEWIPRPKFPCAMHCQNLSHVPLPQIEGGEQVRPGHTEELEKEIEKLRLRVSKLQGELGRNKAVREDDGESTRALVNEVSSLEAEKERLEGEVAKVAEQEEKWRKEISALRSQVEFKFFLED